jgi:hypothetical protein
MGSSFVLLHRVLFLDQRSLIGVSALVYNNYRQELVSPRMKRVQTGVGAGLYSPTSDDAGSAGHFAEAW